MNCLCVIAVLAGCDIPVVLEDEGPSFCLVEEPREFNSADVYDYRREYDRVNLNKDRKTNQTYDDEKCAEIIANASDAA